MKRYPNLLKPLVVSGMTLPNRMVMGAMHTRLETLDRPQQRLATFYARRSQGEIGLILTGGYSPTPEGVMEVGAPYLNDRSQIPTEHLPITTAVKQAGGHIVLQILHAGRYARLDSCVAPSAIQSRINPFAPRALETHEVWELVESYAHTAALAQEAGYAGVEIMGSEGYLINEFTSAMTNHRQDEFGASVANRHRFPVEIVKRVRQRVGSNFMLIYRISAIELIDGGMTGTEVAQLAREIEAAGADLINTGIGWHESRVPTIAASVPRAAWLDAIRNVKKAVSVPVMASNRINVPEVAEAILASGAADLVSMARPLLADPDFARKVRLGEVDEIMPCIACNQACLDLIFTNQTATCMVNPRAGREVEFPHGKTTTPKHLGVVGGGPAGMAFAINAAERGHKVTLYEAERQLGGQLNLARNVPGKNEFNELLRYFLTMLDKLNITVHLNARAHAAQLMEQGFDEIVIATGITPRVPDIPGINHPKVLDYISVLNGTATVGKSAAIVGAGGIGFDVAEFLLVDRAESLDVEAFYQAWGVTSSLDQPGGLVDMPAATPARTIHMLQRKDEPLGRGLGKTTGWILKSRLRKHSVSMIAGASYERIDDEGLHYQVDGQSRVLDVDHVILCAGQLSDRQLVTELQELGVECHVIGGADYAEQLDAVRAIDQATRLAVTV